MAFLPSSISFLSRRQYGLVSASQLREAGVSRYRLDQLMSHGTLEPVHHGVYRFVAVGDSFEQRCLAACLASPNVVISGPSAGRLLALRKVPAGPVHVMLRPGQFLQLPDVIVHRTNRLAEDDVVTRGDGIRLLATERLVFDLARFLDDDDFESVIEQLLDRSMTSIPSLFAVGRSLRKCGRDGSVRFGRVLGRRAAWAKPLGSDLEVRLLRALRQQGVELCPQFAVELPDGSVIHLDGADPVRRFGVEVDHATWHGGRLESAYDKWRDRQLARIGWLVPRVTDGEIERNLGGVVAELKEIYLARRSA